MTIRNLIETEIEIDFCFHFNNYEFFNSQYNKKYVLLRHNDISNRKNFGKYVSWVWDNPVTRCYNEKTFLEKKLR